MPWFAKVILIGVFIWFVVTIISDHVKENRISKRYEREKGYKDTDKQLQELERGNTPQKGSSYPHVNPEIDAVVEEAVTVINDFLNVGRVAQLLTDPLTDFRGLIICVADARPPFQSNQINYGLLLKLNAVSDLELGAQKYPKLLERNPEVAAGYNSFIRKYRYNFDASERGYVYRTAKTVSLRKSEQNKLTAELWRQIEQQCPLAEFGSNGLLYTKNVDHSG